MVTWIVENLTPDQFWTGFAIVFGLVLFACASGRKKRRRKPRSHARRRRRRDEYRGNEYW